MQSSHLSLSLLGYSETNKSVIKAFQRTSAKKATSQTDCSLCCSEQELERLGQIINTEQSGITNPAFILHTHACTQAQHTHTNTLGYLYLVFQWQVSQSLKSNKRAKMNIIYFPKKSSTASCDKAKVIMHLWVTVYSLLKSYGIGS